MYAALSFSGGPHNPSKDGSKEAAGDDFSINGGRGGLCLANLLASHPGLRPWTRDSINASEDGAPSCCELQTVLLCVV